MVLPGEVQDTSDLKLAAGLLNLVHSAVLLADRSGRLLFANHEVRELLGYSLESKLMPPSFSNLIGANLEGVLEKLEHGADGVTVLVHGPRGKFPARVCWLSSKDWLFAELSSGPEDVSTDPNPLIETEPIDSAIARNARHHKDVLEPKGREDDDQVCREWLGGDLLFLAASARMAKIRKQVMQIATVNVPVLIWGESGAGKEVIARMVHVYSARRQRPFLKVNCAALPGELLESELFGYDQGAFTGAVRSKPGKFELANHGTIFLDEIAEMNSHLQSKLLEVLQDGQFTRLGGRNTVRVDVRVLAATNVDVHEAIRQGRFREDLYYRLNVVSLRVPSLRERSSDIPVLLRHFVAKYQKEFGSPLVEPPLSLLEAALTYSWPGNVRELENFAKRHVLLGDGEEDLRKSQETLDKQEAALSQASNGSGRKSLKSLVRTLKDETEMKAIADALEQTRWCRKDAAQMLGISYKALLYKMRQFGLAQPAGELGPDPDSIAAHKLTQ